MVHFINRKNHINVADLLTKFQIHEDSPELWLQYQNNIINPQWLQKDPQKWISTLLLESNSKVAKQYLGNSDFKHDLNATNSITLNPISRIVPNQYPAKDWSIIQSVVCRQSF